MDGQSPAPNAGAPAPEAGKRILEGVGFLRQCRLDQVPVAAIMGSDCGEVADVLGQFVAELPAGAHAARVLAPTDSPQAFLESILIQFGFDPADLTTDDLQRLLVLLLRQCAAEPGGALILVDDAQDFGPRVFEAIRELARNLPRAGAMPMIVLAGKPSLHKVLDSQGMGSIAHLTRWRFDLHDQQVQADGATGGPTAAAPGTTPVLLVSLSGRRLAAVPLGERQLLIGRSTLSDVRLESRFVSRHHAVVIPASGGHWIVDLKSTNGTLVNSRSVRHHRLADGDVISIGNHRIRYQCESATGVSAAPDPSGAETLVMRSLRGIHPLDRNRDDSARRPAA